MHHLSCEVYIDDKLEDLLRCVCEDHYFGSR